MTEAKVVVYSTSSGGSSIQRFTEWMFNVVKAKLKRDPVMVYIDIDGTDKQMIWDKSGKKGVYPLLFVDDEFIGDRDMVEEFNEIGELNAKLKC
eukprot:TRINITY_DN9145_c0_g1_i1.p1 TRINITY_DN9145_c0_g1~~TRINITY_DN9145_c0_g1_i1.p1  ORF type:complete len:106 (-),score=34.50 TRINITY_DN9145_c0_g1_i1:102-383(-)